MLRKLVQDVVEDQREELRSVWKEGTRKMCARVDSPPPEEKKVSYPNNYYFEYYNITTDIISVVCTLYYSESARETS